MSLAVALSLAVVAGSIPYIFGRRLQGRGSPMALIVVAMTSMASMAVASIVILGAVVGSTSVPSGALPTLERCVGVAGELLQHPDRHWPRIVAAIFLLAISARAAKAVVSTHQGSRSQRAALLALPSAISPQGHVVVASDRPFAFTFGAFKAHEVFISQGLIDRLSPEALEGVLAHERAHADGWQGTLHIVGVAIARAFSFFPPMRAAADQLTLGLELAADQRALAVVVDPTVLASALVDVAAHTREQPTGALAASRSGIETRVRRLTQIAAPRTAGRSSLLGHAAAVLSIATLSALIATLPLSARNLTGTARAEAAHAACHLPRD